ncbi:MAG: hypothetical protein JWO19_1828 [Bryobacterales bacterium]|nr:hypothetical protein [Bryobacterales bacterium]
MPSTRLIWPALVLATVLFWAIPLFQPSATIHWDLADVSYPAQKYFADSIHAGRLPYWTPFLYSGMPFLSDPQTGAWYPLHWPFYLFGITPRVLFWELALHSFLALAGAFLLARKLFADPVAAVVAAMFYAWGGFFAAHSSQLGMFEAAALLPWLLWASLGDRRCWLLAGTFAGLIVLAGNFDAALYCFLAFACFLIFLPWRRAAALVVATPAIGFCLSAVVILPWLEISKYAAHPVASPAASLRPIALAAVMSADYFGLISGDYRGPEEIRQFYLYGGLLLLPLAIAGIIRRVQMRAILALIVPGIWYAFGPARVLKLLPGFRDAHAPVEIWFVPALGLALAAGSGAAWVAEKLGQKRLPFILMVVIAADLWHFNMYKSPLVYAATTFDELYGKRQELFEGRIREVKQQPFYRLWMSIPSGAIGPLDGSLTAHTEVSWGAGLLELNRYAEYARAIPSNPRLLHALSANYLVDARGRLEANPSALPRVSVPKGITWVPDAAAARAALASVDPAQSSVVEGPPRDLRQEPVELTVQAYRENFYQVRYSASADTLIRVAVPYAPGWRATTDGAPLAVLPADYAMCGVVVPAGSHQLTLQFRPNYFPLGAALTILGGMGVVFLLLYRL